ncbi:hypothetical protein [Halobellus rubicundus]|uniref:Uncharacterized protein n=1 Tax=Halobellus rubicundus TaxID=2996466 RepID=A0ABD5MDP2_9EURY
MAIEHLERQTFGAELTPLERLVAGVCAVAGGIGHALLAAAFATLLYVLLFVA